MAHADAGAATTVVGDGRDARLQDTLRLDSAEVGASMATPEPTGASVRDRPEPVWQTDADRTPYEVVAELVEKASTSHLARDTLAMLAANPSRVAGVVTGRLVAATGFRPNRYLCPGNERSRELTDVSWPGYGPSVAFAPVMSTVLETRGRTLVDPDARPAARSLYERLQGLRNQIGSPISTREAAQTAWAIRAETANASPEPSTAEGRRETPGKRATWRKSENAVRLSRGHNRGRA